MKTEKMKAEKGEKIDVFVTRDRLREGENSLSAPDFGKQSPPQLYPFLSPTV
jgi:hypothetical protein